MNNLVPVVFNMFTYLINFPPYNYCQHSTHSSPHSCPPPPILAVTPCTRLALFILQWRLVPGHPTVGAPLSPCVGSDASWQASPAGACPHHSTWALLSHARLSQAWTPSSDLTGSDSQCQEALLNVCSPYPLQPPTSHSGPPQLPLTLRHGRLPCSNGF